MLSAVIAFFLQRPALIGLAALAMACGVLRNVLQATEGSRDLLDRRRKLQSPALHEVVCGIVFHIGNFTRFAQTHIATGKFDPDILPLVAHLDEIARPPAVSRLVVAVHVYAIQAFPWRRLAHVLKERLKGFGPPLANRDAASAIMPVRGIMLDLTPTLRPGPRFVNRGSCHSMGTAAKAGRGAIQATAIGPIGRFADYVRVSNKGRSAVASEEIAGLAILAGDPLKGHRSSKPLSGYIPEYIVRFHGGDSTLCQS